MGVGAEPDGKTFGRQAAETLVQLKYKVQLLSLSHIEILLQPVSQVKLDASHITSVVNTTIAALSNRMKSAWDGDKSYDGLAKELLLLTEDSSKSTRNLVSMDGSQTCRAANTERGCNGGIAALIWVRIGSERATR